MWVLILLFVIKVDHPYVEDYEELGSNRNILGWLAALMFAATAALAFSAHSGSEMYDLLGSAKSGGRHRRV